MKFGKKMKTIIDIAHLAGILIKNVGNAIESVKLPPHYEESQIVNVRILEESACNFEGLGNIDTNNQF